MTNPGRAACFTVAALSLTALAALAAPAQERETAGDAALYWQARALESAAKGREATALFQRLIAEYPSSRFVPDAHVNLAESHFNAGRFREAADSFARVEAAPGAKSAGYAAYKRAWCYLNTGENARALSTFEHVLGLAAGGGVADGQREALARETRKDLVRAYARVRPASGAWPYFARWAAAEADVPRMMEALGIAYREAGELGAAREVFRDLIGRQPRAPRACAWQGELIRVAWRQERTEDRRGKGMASDEVAKLIARVDDVARDPAITAADRESCRTQLRDTLKEAALLWHKHAQNTKDKALLERAHPLYKEYLARFKGEQGAYDLAFYAAEVSWILERWDEAAEAYREVLMMNPAGSHTQEAAYAHVLAVKNAVGLDDGKTAGPPPGAPAPVSLPRPVKRMLEAFDTYIAHVKDGAELLKLKYRRARTLYDWDRFAEAAPAFRDIAENHQGSDVAIYSANLYLDCLNALKRSAELCAGARRFRDGPLGARDAELAATMDRVIGDCQRLARKKGARGDR